MGFSTALSGLNAAANNLTVIGNNIANANTVGFKESRSEFVDAYADSLSGMSKTQPGAGVRLAQVAQQFNQGNVELTGNTLDLAINGEGFFTMAATPTDINSHVYTRNGAFHVNKDGIITNTQGQALLAYKPNGSTVAAGFSTGGLTTVSMNTGAGKPVSTSKIDLDVNLDASSPAITVPFDPLDSSTYTRETSVTVYDSLGVSHKMTTYFVAQTATPPTRDWTAHHYITDNPLAPVSIDTAPVPAGATLTFDSTGKLTVPASGQVPLAPFVTGTSAANIVATIDYSGSSQLSTTFSVNAIKQDGLPAGTLTGIAIDKEGVIFANFSNGNSTPLGKVAMTRFTNPQGLTKLGDGAWGESSASGSPIIGSAGEGTFGSVQSGALEQSNVDISKQLVSLILAQQTYQANSQTIQTEKSVIDQIMNLR
ncbi:flagellar hook protein FlgE [Methyloglobulus morosus KoM1]|uniref:Flagellar hook protein FlgE n=1 Tax=Methyloglobulus morosus KoM1 TaxID=1116472 RepID=V5C9A6_9GAMM|nr:flagellar hook protein FlgE [Methyloglobulus morosus]ESS73368.1 flagellar hook protein FlgE [Methyloglobulus morosus KoM1]